MTFNWNQCYDGYLLSDTIANALPCENGTVLISLFGWQSSVEMIEKYIKINNIGDIDMRDENGSTMLMHTQNLQVAQYLINNGANVNAVDNNGSTVLHYFAEYLHMTQNEQLIAILINHGATIHNENENGNIALNLIASDLQPNINSIKMLCDSGNKLYLDHANHFNETPLMLSLKGSIKSSGAIEYFLSHGANINLVDRNGNSAIMIHMNDRKRKMCKIQLLMKFNPDLSIVNKDGKTVFDYVNKSTGRSTLDLEMIEYFEQFK